jgi:antitoxin VapB
MYMGAAMALHINDTETDKLARELARETGETLTVAVNKAVKERLDRVGAKNKMDRERFIAELTRIAKGAKGLRRQKKTSRELIEDLYDENGLPR